MARKKKRETAEQELSLDFSKISSFFKRFEWDQIATIGLVLIAIMMVFYIRMLPASLPVTDDWAEQTIQDNLRNQFAQQVNQQYPALPQANKDDLINKQIAEFLEQQKAQLGPAKAQLSEQIKERLRYAGDDGNQYTYLGDLDSYFWLRYTRNYLETGTPCDAISERGECMDMYLLAPVGSLSSAQIPLHSLAIAYLYNIISLFKTDYPLPATSFFVPVLIGTLGVIPAFFIGRRLAGNVAGVFAALLISLHPLVLSRSMGSDNDIWNIVLPLFIMWMTIEALEAKDPKYGNLLTKHWYTLILSRKFVFSALAALFMGIFSWSWIGWWFVYLIIFLGLLGNLGFRAGQHVIQQRDFKILKRQGVKAALFILIAFYFSSAIFTSILGNVPLSLNSDQGMSYWAIPTLVVSSSSNLDRAIAGEYWPNVLTTVAELNKSSFSAAVGQMGGKLFFFGCLVGLLLMILPRKKWHWQHFGVMAVGALISLWLINKPPASKFTVLFLLGLPIVITLLFYLFRKEKVNVTDALIVLVWFLSTVYATYSGVRFILLMIPAYGIAFAVTAGRIHQWISDYLQKDLKWNKQLTVTLVFLVMLFLLVTPVKSGYGTARGFVPTIDDAWWDSLTKIREESAPNAIINSWWDFGHWFKYVADRRVSADGVTQHTHVPHWLGKALVTPDEKESVGILRMLDCGSDAYPSILGDFGAYGKVIKKVEDPIAAEHIVVDLINLEKEDARAYLQDLEFTTEEQDSVLNSTHCDAPENYFITSGDMVGKAGVWAHFGLWDFEKAYLVQTARNMPQAEAVESLVEKFGYTAEEATQKYFQAVGLSSENDINAYVSPWPGYVSQNWRACGTPDNGTTIVCNLNLGIGRQGNTITAIESFIFNSSASNESEIVFSILQNGQKVQETRSKPGKIVVARDTGLESFTYADSPSPNIAVLIEPDKNRILLADPHLVDSMFTQLFYLEGRYSKHYKKFDDRITFSGSRILVWKVDWNGEEAQQTGTTVNITR